MHLQERKTLANILDIRVLLPSNSHTQHHEVTSSLEKGVVTLAG